MIIEKANIFDAEDILKIQKMAFISQAEIYNDFTIHPLVETLEEIKSEFENKVVFKAIINELCGGSIILT